MTRTPIEMRCPCCGRYYMISGEGLGCGYCGGTVRKLTDAEARNAPRRQLALEAASKFEALRDDMNEKCIAVLQAFMQNWYERWNEATGMDVEFMCGMGVSGFRVNVRIPFDPDADEDVNYEWESAEFIGEMRVEELEEWRAGHAAALAELREMADWYCQFADDCHITVGRVQRDDAQTA